MVLSTTAAGTISQIARGFSSFRTSSASEAAPTAFSGSNVLALASAIAERQEEATAYRRDYEERAKELAEDAAFEESAAEASADLFTDAAAQEAAAAKALAATRRFSATADVTRPNNVRV